jgi:hypothetical protein
MSSHCRQTPLLSKSQDLFVSNFAVASITFWHSYRLLPSGVISESSSRRGSDDLSASVILAVCDGMSVSDPGAE